MFAGSTERSFISFTRPQVFADAEGIIEVKGNTLLQFCLAYLNGGGIKSGGNVSISGNAVVSSCTALVGGGVFISGEGAVVEIRGAAEIVGCAAERGGVCHLLDKSALTPHTQVG